MVTTNRETSRALRFQLFEPGHATAVTVAPCQTKEKSRKIGSGGVSQQFTQIRLPVEIRHLIYSFLTVEDLLHKISILSRVERKRVKNSKIVTAGNGIFIYDDHE